MKAANLIQAAIPDIEVLDAQEKKARSIRERFADSICHVFKPEAAVLVLSHVQGVFLREETKPCKDDFEVVRRVLEIHSDDSTVKSELDARQESIKMQMMKRGLFYDDTRLKASRGMMRQNAPFAVRVEELQGVQERLAAWEPSHDMSADEVDALVAEVSDERLREVIRRALNATAGR